MAITRMNPLRGLWERRSTLYLMSGRMFGFLATFAIPMVVARTLDSHEFGTYRLLFLLYTTALMLAQFGLSESLYYFLPRHPSTAGRWVGNAVVGLSVIGLAVVVLTWAGAPLIAARFRNPLLMKELPKLAIFLALTLMPLVLEIVMTCRGRFGLAAAAYGSSDAVKAAALITPAILMHSLDALMIGAIVFAALRCAATLWYLGHEFGSTFRVSRELWKPHLAYALPFAASVGVEYAQYNLHQYAVALWFDPATFAIYSIGCLQIPLVDFLATSAGNVMMVSMSEQIAKGKTVLPLWHDTVEQLAAVFFPMVAVLLLVAHTLIPLMFPGYGAATPIFMVSTGLILLAAIPVDSVLRVYADTRMLLWLSLARLVLIASSIAWFVSRYQLIGAVLVTVGAAVITRAVAVGRIAVLIGAPLRRVLPWGSLATTTAASVVAIAPAWYVRTHVSGAPLLVLLITSVTYGLTYLAVQSGGAMLRQPAEPAAEPSQAA